MTCRSRPCRTCRAPGPLLESFLRYHFLSGVDQIFLFFDDPEDDARVLSKKLKTYWEKDKVGGISERRGGKLDPEKGTGGFKIDRFSK